MADACIVKQMLQRDGYVDAVKLIEALESSISRRAEFEYLKTFICETSFDDDLSRDRLRMLWTVYCLHHGLDVDTGSYDSGLLELWDLTDTPDCDNADWHDFDSFDGFMCKYLV